MSIRQQDTWVLTAEWYDGDTLRHGHAFFSTQRDGHAVGDILQAKHAGPDADFTFTVEKASPWVSSARSAPFTDPVTVEFMASSTEREWDLS